MSDVKRLHFLVAATFIALSSLSGCRSSVVFQSDANTKAQPISQSSPLDPNATPTPGGGGDPSSFQNARSPVGANLAEVASWTPEWIFVDQFMKSRPWIAGGCASGSWDTGQALGLDANGWVDSAPSGVCPRTLLLDYRGRVPGTYVLLWNGAGSIRIGGSTYSGGRATLTVDGGSDPLVLDLYSGTSGFPKQIRMIMPGGVCRNNANGRFNSFASCATSRGGSGACGPGETCVDFEQASFNRFIDPADSIQGSKVVFHPVTLERLKKYRAIRFMDWMKTNNSPLGSWSARTTLSSPNMSLDTGVAYELLIALCNVLGTDAWITLPHQADNDFVQRAAALFKAGLHPSLKTYVELSNEVWNGIFAQRSWALGWGQSRGLCQGADETTCVFRSFGARTVEVMDLWASVYGADHRARYVRVMGAWAGSNWYTGELLAHNSHHTKVDAVAIAPYFGGYLDGNSVVASFSLDRLFTEILTEGEVLPGQWDSPGSALEKSALDMSRSREIASRHGLELLAYEGGQHLVGVGALTDNAAMTSLFQQANRDARMGQAYSRYLASWKENGGRLFMIFNHLDGWSKWGSWGSLEYQTQPLSESPKQSAVQQFIQSNPCWWTGCR